MRLRLNMVMKYVHKLNLPLVNQVFLESFKGFDDDNKVVNYQYREDLKNIIRPEWCSYRNIKWDHLLYFKKADAEGKIHTDIRYSLLNTSLGMNSTPWGITWVFEGDGLLEYWNFDQVDDAEVTNGSDNNKNKGIVKTYTSKVPPIAQYRLLNNNCYLVCGKYPHRATGFGGRKVISLRSSHLTYNITWDSIVNMFQDLII